MIYTPITEMQCFALQNKQDRKQLVLNLNLLP